MPIPEQYKRKGAVMAKVFGDMMGFRRGGRIMKGSIAMKRKMAKLRAMKK